MGYIALYPTVFTTGGESMSCSFLLPAEPLVLPNILESLNIQTGRDLKYSIVSHLHFTEEEMSPERSSDEPKGHPFTW